MWVQDDDIPGFVHDLRKEATAQTVLHNGGTSGGKRSARAPAAAGSTSASVAAGTVGRFNPEAGEYIYPYIFVVVADDTILMCSSSSRC